MILHRYNDYVIERVDYEILLESKLVLSKNFIGLLNRMKSNKLASQLLSLYSKEVPLQHNFIDTTEEKDSVSFTPDRKVQELIAGKPEEWKIINSGRCLTHGKANSAIFGRLGYDTEDRKEPHHPDMGTVGTIAAESVSPTTGKIFIKFKYDDGGVTKFTCLNKDAIQLVDPSEDAKIWKTSRNNIKVGRLVRSILTASKIPIIDKDIEEFTNQYKATFDFTKDLLKQFDIVKGKDIAHWYSSKNYVQGGGTLNNSCMAHVEKEYFDIYCENPQVSLVILYGDGGVISDDKYTDTKIKGRAILWDAMIDDVPVKFMDRIYTVKDSDTDLFKQFAAKNGWWCKRGQNMSPEEPITDGVVTKNAKITVKLDVGDHDRYPYIDTMCYLSSDNNLLTNFHTNDSRLLKSTEGYWEGYYTDDDDDEYYDDDYDDEDDDDIDHPN